MACAQPGWLDLALDRVLVRRRREAAHAAGGGVVGEPVRARQQVGAAAPRPEPREHKDGREVEQRGRRA